MEANMYYALPEPFDPVTTNLDFDQWVRKFKACAVANQWQEADQIRHLPPLLRGDAWIVYDELTAEEKDTKVHLTKSLSDKLNAANQIQSAEKLYQRVFDDNMESLLSYQNDLKRLAHRAYPEMTPQQVSPIILTAFIRGLKGHSASLARRVRNANPRSLQQALEKAQFFMSDPFPDDTQQDQHEVMAISKEPPQPLVRLSKEDEQYLHSDTIQDNGEVDGVNSPPTWLPEVISAINKASARVCDYCGKSGHIEANCYKKQRDEGRRSRPHKRPFDDSIRNEYPRTPGAVCTYCAKRNHTEEQCQIKKNAEALAKEISQGN